MFSDKPGGYKAGVGLLLASTVLLIVGFATPKWATNDRGLSGGLWKICIISGYSGDSVCTTWEVWESLTGLKSEFK